MEAGKCSCVVARNRASQGARTGTWTRGEQVKGKQAQGQRNDHLRRPLGERIGAVRRWRDWRGPRAGTATGMRPHKFF